MTAVVMLHGWGMPASIFDELSHSLAVQFEVSTPDLPGYGAASSCEPCTLESLAAYLAAQAPPRCFVVGWSLGAQVALEWARAKPEQVCRLVLMGATPAFVERAEWRCAMDALVFDAFSGTLAEDRASALSHFAALQAHGDSQAKRVTRHLRKALSEHPVPSVEVLQSGLRMLRENDLRPHLGDVHQPALVVHGENDRLVPQAAGEYLARALGNGQIATVIGAAHAPFVSNPASVARSIAEFFS
jgi:pimeloyl-[acyl-carrier protein] methyl ester esterase